MTDKLPKEVARVVNSSKLEDRFLKSEIYTPTDTNKRKKGTLYFLIEILNPWHPSAQIAEMIIETVKQEYYRIDERPAKCFERALASINKQLSSLAKEGETSWVGNLNAVVAALVDDKIFLSHTGSAQAFLFRGEKISRVSKGVDQSQDSTYPFLEITNGKLRLEDRFAIANSDFFDFISLDTLRDVIKDDGPKKTAQYVKDVLSRESYQSVNSILIKIGPPSPNSSALPDVVYLRESNVEDKNKYIAACKKAFRKYAPIIRKKIIKLGYFIIEKVKRTNRFLSDFALSTSHDDEDQPDRVEGWDKYTGQSIKKENNKSKPKSKIYDLIVSIGRFIGSIDKRWLIGIVVALIIVLVAGFYFNQTTSRSQNIDEEIGQIESMISSAKTEVALNQEEDARDLLSQAQTKLEKYRDNPDLVSRVESLSSEIEKIINQIDNITVVDSPWQDLADLNEYQFNADDLEFYQNFLFTVNKDFGQIYRINSKNNRINQIDSLPQKAGAVNLITKSSIYNQLLFYTSENLIYLYDVIEDKIELVDISISTDSVSSWDTFDSNLYLYNKDSGTVWRYSQGTFGYSSAQPLVNDQEIINALDMTIDGDIYFLKDNGTITKYSLGEINQYQLSGLPNSNSQINNPKKIYTNDQINKLYIIDGRRVIVINKENGKYRKQYQLPIEVDDLLVSGGQIYFLTSNNLLYRTNI
jgi:hypothetical protein